MAEETLIDNLTRGHQFDGGPFALDLYRLLGMVLSDKQIAALGDEDAYSLPSVWQLQGRFRKPELLRILISSAVALRILLDHERDPRIDRWFKRISEKRCGDLWEQWDKRAKTKQTLTLRAACNKLIHATDVRDDLVISDRRRNPDELGLYMRPFVYLYGAKDGTKWRAKLSIVDFAINAASVFVHFMPE